MALGLGCRVSCLFLYMHSRALLSASASQFFRDIASDTVRLRFHLSPVQRPAVVRHLQNHFMTMNGDDHIAF
jgi:hypothetical protein